MKKKINCLYILIFMLLLVLACFFPLTGEDLFWANLEMPNFFEALKVQGYGVIPSLLLFTLTKFKILRVIFVSVIAVALCVLLKNVVSKNNKTLFYLSLFFILLSDKLIFSHFFINATGFIVHLFGSMFLLIFIKLFVNNSVARMKSASLIVLGLLGGLLTPLYSFIIFLSTMIFMIRCDEEDFRKKYLILMASEVVGLLITVLNSKLVYSSFSTNLIHGLMSSIRGVNFFSTLIFSAFVMFMAIKVFIKGKRLGSVLSILGVSSFLFVSLLSSSDVLAYISFIGYFVGSFYILYNARKNKLFRYKIYTYYLFKLLMIIFLCLFGNIECGSVLFLFLIDILIILEMYNYIFPQNFLQYVWLGVSLCIIGMNIYIYRSVQSKYDEMNVYIKNELECYTEDFSIPGRYETDYVYKLVPNSKQEFEEYVKYFHINVYDKNKNWKFEFTK